MSRLTQDVFTEPANIDIDTLKNLGPLTLMAGVWESVSGTDLHPVAAGAHGDVYVEHIELQPIDPQTNGPQLLYGLRYHVHIIKPGTIGTFHDQVGYWLWEPATGMIIQTLTIPRGQTALAMGNASVDATEFTLEAKHGNVLNGICSSPFLEEAFKTLEYHIKVTIGPDETWSYDQDTVIMVLGTSTPFHHTDSNTLKKIANPTPNPLAQAAIKAKA
ncbi:MAG: FABP family protein [Candidatus Melainabacteria bacterium]|nr:FABP family protein [Candidatus Melainabacteria bacterium]